MSTVCGHLDISMWNIHNYAWMNSKNIFNQHVYSLTRAGRLAKLTLVQFVAVSL